MLKHKRPARQRDHDAWQDSLRHAVRDANELCRRLDLDPRLASKSIQPHQQFPLLVPNHFVGLIEPGNPNDPLLRQVLPQQEEMVPCAGYSMDPLQENQAGAPSGLVRKYHNRSLILTTTNCAIHCRYCFRRWRHHDPVLPQQQKLAAIRQADTEEIILSGGDPLILHDSLFATLLKACVQNPKLKRLRIHTRIPIVLPERITIKLCNLLHQQNVQMIMVLHTNHPHELHDKTATAINRLRNAGITLLNQSVLLRGVNDQADTLEQLNQQLFTLGVIPYYLHLLDPVHGCAHFDVDSAIITDLLKTIRARLPGYLVPRAVREQPGATSKVPFVDMIPE
jgi:EF-P beta-lysylation protein EpmB